MRETDIFYKLKILIPCADSSISAEARFELNIQVLKRHNVNTNGDIFGY